MNCPKCNSQRVYVVMAKPTQDGDTLRRRRCDACEHRWYTLQQPEEVICSSRIEWRNRRKAYMPIVTP